LVVAPVDITPAALLRTTPDVLNGVIVVVPVVTVNPLPAVSVVVLAMEPGAINVAGIDNVTAPVAADAVIWLAVPVMEVTPPAGSAWKLGAAAPLLVNTVPAPPVTVDTSPVALLINAPAVAKGLILNAEPTTTLLPERSVVFPAGSILI
jgi:hypothetical protein